MATGAQSGGVVHNLEPRLTTVETELKGVVRQMSSLTTDVHELVRTVNTLGENTSREISKLLVDLTAAQAPRKTEWGAVISAAVSVIGLTMAIGAAVLSPLFLRVTDLQRAQTEGQAILTEHTKLKLHPVGETRIDCLEKLLVERGAATENRIGKIDDKLEDQSTLINLLSKDIHARVTLLEARVNDLKKYDP